MRSTAIDLVGTSTLAATGQATLSRTVRAELHAVERLLDIITLVLIPLDLSALSQTRPCIHRPFLVLSEHRQVAHVCLAVPRYPHNSIQSEAIVLLVLRSAQLVQETALSGAGASLTVELSDIILGRFGQRSPGDVAALGVDDVSFILATLRIAAAVRNQHDPHIILRVSFVDALGRRRDAAVEAVRLVVLNASAHLDLLYPLAPLAYLRRLLVVEASPNHFVVAHELIRILVRVAEGVVHSARVVHAYVPVGLGYLGLGVPRNSNFRLLGIADSLVACIASDSLIVRSHVEHRCGVAVLERILSSLHLLLLDEVIMMAARGSILSIRIIPRVPRVHLLLNLFVADVSLLLLSSRAPHEDDTVLVQLAVVRATVRPLLVVVVSAHLPVVLLRDIRPVAGWASSN